MILIISLNFSPKLSHPLIKTSPSGLMAYVPLNVKEQVYCVAGQPINSSFYWELICPYSCDGLKFGLIEEGFTRESA